METSADKAQVIEDHAAKIVAEQDAVVEASYAGNLEAVCRTAPNSDNTIVVVNTQQRAALAKKLLEGRKAPSDKIRVVIKPQAQVPCWNRVGATVMQHDNGHKAPAHTEGDKGGDGQK